MTNTSRPAPRTAYVRGTDPRSTVAVTVLDEQPSPDGLPYITVEYAGIEYVVREVFPTP
jgi:hypothetical protein